MTTSSRRRARSRSFTKRPAPPRAIAVTFHPAVAPEPATPADEPAFDAIAGDDPPPTAETDAPEVHAAVPEKTVEVEERPEPMRARLLRRLRSPGGLLVTGITAIVLFVHAWNITGFPAASDDEGTYLAQAWAVRQGLGLGHYTYWYDHPPLAWIQLAALSWLPAALSEGLSVPTGRYAMLAVTAAILLLTYLLGRRLGLPRWAAAVAVLCYGLSPLAVTTQRQIYLDSFAVAWLLGALVLALSPRRHLWHHVAAGAAAATAALCKETMIVALPAVVLALWQGTARNGVRAFSFAGFGSGLLLVGGFYPLFAMLNGELLPGPGHVSLIGAWQFQLHSRTGSGSVFTAGSPANTVVGSWLYYDAVLLAGGVLAAAVALAVRRLRVPAVAVALLTVVALRPGGYLPTMYVIQALPFLALCLAGVLALAVRHALTGPPGEQVPGWRRTVLLGLAVLAVGVVGVRWSGGVHRALTARDNTPYEAAAAWLRERVPDRARTRVVVDDVLWLDLVRDGFPRENVLWFYKVDLDAKVAAELPRGWRDVDYVVSTPAMRGDRAPLPTVDALLEHSDVLATFGSGSDRIEIRWVPDSPADRR
ncbi:ArnT family glycosyltransferase [Catellatospora aurea]|uniref:ArnT family glycosyltransferase n=1 Tax=Catellatospora aurea TaxID=1337874 RepID=A0ABW2H2G3_9ACTN